MNNSSIPCTAKKRHRVSPLPYLYLLPSLLLFGLFVFYPFAKTVLTSLYSTDPAGRPVDFVGWNNYTGTFAIIVFILGQKTLIQGLTAGAVKG